MSHVNHSKFRKAAPARVEQRAAPRYEAVITSARSQRKNCGSVPVKLADLSIYGCRLEVAGEYREGTDLRVAIDGGEWIKASVVWSKDGLVGCRFADAQDKEWVRRLTLYAAL